MSRGTDAHATPDPSPSRTGAATGAETGLAEWPSTASHRAAPDRRRRPADTSIGRRRRIVSKTLRHSTLATTVNIYGHLLPQAAREAVTALADALDHADLPCEIN
ncbi:MULTISPECIES: hypothetical protein [unclassified Kitasatospora]|uniref:hypothetical protein n=1 Tax=unclassified Kitasatospora TaxID=2633591 RepID=UPI0033E8B174